MKGVQESAVEDPPCAFLEDLEGQEKIEAWLLEGREQPKQDLMGAHVPRKKALKVTSCYQPLLLQHAAKKGTIASRRDLGVSTRA